MREGMEGVEEIEDNGVSLINEPISHFDEYLKYLAFGGILNAQSKNV
jgi:hypothetical protein